jgi:hypothetical protein
MGGRNSLLGQCLLALCGALVPASSYAAAPLATDDADVLAAFECEVEPYFARLSLPGNLREDTFNAQLGCGLGGEAQLAVGFGRSNRSDAQNHGRRESLALSGKTVLHKTPDGAAIAVLAGSVMGRTGGGPFRFDSVYATAAVTVPLGTGLTGHANLGWVRSRPDRTHTTAWNLALEAVWRPGIDAAIEVYGDDRNKPWLGLGLRWSVSQQLKFGASYAVQSDTLRQRLVSVGATWAF